MADIKVTNNTDLESLSAIVSTLDTMKINPKVIHPDMIHQEMIHPDMIHPEMIRPEMIHPEMIHPDMIHQEMIHPDMIHQEMIHPEMIRPEMIHPEMIHPEMIHPELIRHEMIQRTTRRPTMEKVLKVIAGSDGLKLKLGLMGLFFSGPLIFFGLAITAIAFGYTAWTDNTALKVIGLLLLSSGLLCLLCGLGLKFCARDYHMENVAVEVYSDVVGRLPHGNRKYRNKDERTKRTKPSNTKRSRSELELRPFDLGGDTCVFLYQEATG